MKVGLFGLGSIGRRHLLTLTGLGHQVYAYDPDPQAQKHMLGMQSEKLVPGLADTIDEVLDMSEAFIIATPINTHYWYLQTCASTGKPIFCEKPLTDQVDDVLDTKNVKMVGYNLRFHSCVLKAKAWIDAGHLGTPLWANFVLGQKNKKYKEHVILNWSHEIDLACHLLGPAAVAAAVGGKDLVDLTLIHNGSNQSTIHLDYLTEPEIRQFIIVGNKASIIATLAPARVAWLRDASGYMLETFEGRDDWDDNYVDEIESFVARCEGIDTVGATAEDGLAVAKICLDAIERSKK